MEKICTDAAWLCWIEAHPGLASWFQAFGSIAALIVAFGAPKWIETGKHQAAVRRARAAVRQRYTAAVGLAISFAEVLKIGLGADALYRAYPYAELEEAISDLKSASLTDTECPPSIGPFGELKIKLTGFLVSALRVRDVDEAKFAGEYRALMVAEAEGLAALLAKADALIHPDNFVTRLRKRVTLAARKSATK